MFILIKNIRNLIRIFECPFFFDVSYKGSIFCEHSSVEAGKKGGKEGEKKLEVQCPVFDEVLYKTSKKKEHWQMKINEN